MSLAGLLLPLAVLADPGPAVATPPSDGGVIARAQRERTERRALGRYDEVFRRYSKRYFGVAFDWRWFKAQGMAESNLDSAAVSHAGARGVMQLMPSTYRAIQSKETHLGAIDDPEWNIAAGILHNQRLWKRWHWTPTTQDRFAFMFGSYNAGEGTIGRALRSARTVAGDTPTWNHVEQVAPQVPRWRYRETLGYVRRIRENHARLTGTSP